MTISRSLPAALVTAVMLFAAGCSGVNEYLWTARSSFPLKYLYRPSYATIGTIYATDPAFAIELLERRCRRKKHNLPYRLTLADMYRDRGRVNEAIRLWFEILALSRAQGIADGSKLQVYFIPIEPDQEEGMRPYGRMIDKSLAYFNIGMIYFQNALFEEASEYFLKAGRSAVDPDRKAALINRAGVAIGSKRVEFVVSEKDGKPYQKLGDRMVSVDPMQFRKRERALYEEALALVSTDQELRQDIENNLSVVRDEIEGYAKRFADVEQEQEAEGGLPSEELEPPDAPEDERSGDRWGEAQSRMRQGEFSQALEIWQELFAGFPPQAYIIEVELDCKQNTVYKTFESLGEPDNFFILPKVYKGVDCYRVCLGPYELREEAVQYARRVKTDLQDAEPWVRLVDLSAESIPGVEREE
jgi:tetratricopeptide (TPR) repeat protein